MPGSCVARRTFVRLVLLVLFAALLPFAPGPSTAATTVCDLLPGLTANVWKGLGVTPGADDEWENDANWSLGIAPVRLSNPYVCIPAGGAPVIRAGQEAQLVTLDVAQDGLVRVDPGGKLFLYGGVLTPSVIRGRVDVDGGAFGGPARVQVSGTLRLRSPGSDTPATITTRECAFFPGPFRLGEELCVPGLPILGLTGQIAVDDEGTLDVSGGEVRLGDQFQLRVRGLLRVHDGGYVTADHGTRLELLPHAGATPGAGTLRFEGDGGYLEGRNDLGIPDLGTVVNRGRIIKSAGSGTSFVTGTYSQPAPGTVQVNSGTLLLPSGAATPATVGAGAEYGSGRCAVPRDPGCQVQTFDGDRQNVQFQVPAGTSGASVLVQELTARSSPADIGFPVHAHADGLSATAAVPAILTLRYDERLLGGRGWTSVDVFRRADGTATYVELEPCLPNGNPRNGQEACVDRRGLAESSRNVFDAEGPGSAPDVIMVVRALGTSRWVAR